MREIKFRGKSLITDKWVHGYYYNMDDNRKGSRRHIIVYESDSSGPQTIHEPVEPETLGQFTGLKDKNRTEIYEGDLVKTYNGDLGIVEYGPYIETDIVDVDSDFYIDADREERMTVGFHVKDHRTDSYGLDTRTDKWITVIGNIYEHKHLMEVNLNE